MAVNAFLLPRLASKGMDEKDGAVMLGMKNGLTRKEIADRQGVS